MSGFLLDTNVVSMLAPGRESPPAGLVQWLRDMDGAGRVFLSVVTIHEIERGIGRLEHRGATAKAADLRLWLAGLVSAYGDRIVGVDASAAALGGRLEARALAGGHEPGMADAIIAGIAQAKDLRVVTRNTRHFLPFGIAVSSPDDAIGLV